MKAKLRAYLLITFSALLLAGCATKPADQSGLYFPQFRYSEIQTNTP